MSSTTTTIPSSNAKTKTFLIGLSGPSSSGKTTLARLLRSIFDIPASPETNQRGVSFFILHEDDFYKTDADIPVITTPSPSPSTLPPRRLQDWDCVESLNLPLLSSTLTHVKHHGTLPASSFSKEDQNAVGPSTIPDPDALITQLKASVISHLKSLPSTEPDPAPTTQIHPDPDPDPVPIHIRICILDGFLLYPFPHSANPLLQHLHTLLSDTLSLKLFLPCSRAQTISRRAKRSGYVTLEGFWADPEGYVEDVVWPNYARDHAWMFDSNNANTNAAAITVAEEKEGLEIDETATLQEKILVAPGKGQMGMEGLVRWGVAVVLEGLSEREGGRAVGQ